MAGKEVAIGKRLKISQAQEYMILAVLAAAAIVGAAVSLSIKMISGINFSAKVIAEEEKSVAKYEAMVKNVNTLRDSIVGELAEDEALKSVAGEGGTALQVIPDALPAYKNEEALLASLNKIFKVSNWEPENIQPSGAASEYGIEGMDSIGVSLTIEANAETVTTVLNNINRSIREFDINQAKIEWNGTDSLSVKASATAYYTTPAALEETTIKMKREE